MSAFLKPMHKLLMTIMTKLTPTCQVVTQRISESLDGRKLTLRERIGIKLHLLGCELCERYRKQILMIQDLLSRYASKMEEKWEDDGKLRPEVRERIRKVIESHQHDSD